MSREQRIVTRCRVEFDRLQQCVRAISEDLSASGAFVRTTELLPENATVVLKLFLPTGYCCVVTARVAHLMSSSIARALGRQIGMGFEFLEFEGEGRERLESYLDLCVDEVTPPPAELAVGAKVVIADPSFKLLERLTTALTDAQFEPFAVEDGAAALEAIRARRPHIVLAADDLPTLDGWTLVKRLLRQPELCRLPVVLMSDDTSDMTRLQAYRLGVRDFIPRPFTDEELCLRLRRIVLHERNSQAAVLRGNLSEISTATLLSLLDFERKSGVLLMLTDGAAARLFVDRGRVVRIDGGSQGSDSRLRLFEVLDWHQGSFEFTGCGVEGRDDIGLSTQRLLLEHARARDEEREDGPTPSGSSSRS